MINNTGISRILAFGEFRVFVIFFIFYWKILEWRFSFLARNNVAGIL